jgi:hypothetical protein
MIGEENGIRASGKQKESTANGYIHPYPLNAESLASCVPTSQFMAGMRIYLHPDTALSESLLSSLKECVIASGATILDESIGYSNEGVDVYIGRWRSGEDYKQASKDGKIVGSVWWLSNTLSRNRIEPPTRTLLDYPSPRSGVKEMHHMVIICFLAQFLSEHTNSNDPLGDDHNELQWCLSRLCSASHSCPWRYIYP